MSSGSRALTSTGYVSVTGECDSSATANNSSSQSCVSYRVAVHTTAERRMDSSLPICYRRQQNPAYMGRFGANPSEPQSAESTIPMGFS